MVDVLRLTATYPAEQGALVAHLVSAFGGTLSVRASLSRALRRLWRRGCVDLHTQPWADCGRTMGERHAAAVEEYEQALADPAAAYYRTIGGFARAGIAFDPWGSPDAYLNALRRAANRLPSMRIVRVTLTDAGRLTAAQWAGVNREAS